MLADQGDRVARRHLRQQRDAVRLAPERQAVGQALSTWPGSMILVSHDPGFVEELRPDRVLLMPDGDVDWWSDDLLELVALA